MKKIIIAAVLLPMAFISSAFADNIDVMLKYNNENNSVSVSGSARVSKDNTSFTLVVMDPDGKEVFADIAKGGAAADGISSFKFDDMPFGLTSPGGVYSFAVSGYKIGAAPVKTYTYTDCDTLLKTMKKLSSESDYISFIKNNAVILSVDASLCGNLGTNGTAVFTELMKNEKYTLPESCVTDAEYEVLRESAKKMRDNYARFASIAAFNDITSIESLRSWLDLFEESYGISSDEKLYNYVKKQRERGLFADKIVNEKFTDMDAVKERIYEKALLCHMASEHYSESVIILRDYSDKFNYNKANLGKLSDSEQISVYTSFAGKSFNTYKEAAAGLDSLVNSALAARADSKPGGSGGGGGGSSSSSGSAAGGGVVAAPAETSNSRAFNDISGVSWAKEAIEYLADKGIISGRGNGSFAPDDKITRAEFIKIICGVLNIEFVKTNEAFSDVSDDAWYAGYVYAARNAGIAMGDTENRFNPDGKITREDMAALLYRAYKIESDFSDIDFSDESDISDYAKNAVAYFAKSGIINGVGENKFSPRSDATRAEAAKMIYECIKKYS